MQRGGILHLEGTAPLPVNLFGICNAVWQGVQVEGPGQNGARVFLPASTTPLNYGILNTHYANIHDAIFGAVSTTLPLMDVNTLSAQILSMPTNPIVPTGWGYTPSMVTSLLYNGVLTAPQAFSNAGGMLKISANTFFSNCLEGVNMPWYKTQCNVGAPNEPCECFVRGATFNSSQLAYPFNAGLTAPVKTEAGIHLLNYFPLTDKRLALDANQFTNLNYGIRAAGLQNTDISNNQMTDCTVGVSVLNYSYFELMTHSILVQANQLNNCAVGIQASRTELRIAGNSINNNYIPPTGTLATANHIGMFIHGSNANVTNNNINYTRVGVALLSNNTDPVYISNNQFNVNAVGVYSLGNNKAAQILCNDFYNYAVAIGAQNYTSATLLYPSEEGYLSDQGDCDPFYPRPADNLFSMPLSATLSAEIAATPYPVANNFIYWYRNAPGFIPLTTYGEVTPQGCVPSGTGILLPRETLCGEIGSGMIMDDNDIRNLTDENVLNYEALKKARYYVYDQNNRLAAEGLLEDIQTYLAERMLLNSYLIQGNLEAANQQLANLPNATQEEQQFRQLYQIYANWRQTGRTLFEITPEEENTVRQIASATTQTATEARTLLYLRYGEEYPIDLPPLSNLIDPALFENVYINFKGGATNNPYLSTGIGKPYPNPAKSGFSIDYNLGKDAKAQLTFYSPTGNIQASYTLTGNGTYNIATAEWVSGMYYYRVITENGSIISGKVAVFK